MAVSDSSSIIFSEIIFCVVYMGCKYKEIFFLALQLAALIMSLAIFQLTASPYFSCFQHSMDFRARPECYLQIQKST